MNLDINHSNGFQEIESFQRSMIPHFESNWCMDMCMILLLP